MFFFINSIRFATCFNELSFNRGKMVAKQKKQRENVFFKKNVFDLNQNHFQVFQTLPLLKNTKETSGETQKA